jgi:hypothetical protein
MNNIANRKISDVFDIEENLGQAVLIPKKRSEKLLCLR